MLSKRRFPDTVHRKREHPGRRNQYGEFVPGALEFTEFSASVQPLALQDSDFVGGARTEERLKVYIPEAGALLAAFADRRADNAIVNGFEYVVEETQASWSNHTRAILFRES